MTAYLFVFGAVAIAGSAVFFLHNRSLPYTTCPSTTLITDRQACRGWTARELNDVRIIPAADGACQVCVNPIAREPDRAGVAPAAPTASCDYQQIARAQASKAFPHYPTERPLVFHDEGDTREVSFQLPNGYAGGSPHIDIRKSTCTVSRVFGTQ
ncbi:MAG TPA: hypothetical protein VKQ70_12975 [Caulobacteraceae bacterium]|nr:hypothetical protein [Caulobacteraceae bacterium]